MKIAVIGTGYVGLTSGTCFAEMGNKVICVDIDAQKIENLKKGLLPIYEPGLEELVIRNFREGRLKFTTDSKQAIEEAEVVFSAVGTPPDQDHKADLKYVKEVAREFGKHLNDYKVFVNKSTVPVGTGNFCQKLIQEELDKRGVTHEFDAISNPEFLREGTAIKDTMNPNRIVIGYERERAKEVMIRLYHVLIEKGCKAVFTDLRTAEIIKYAANAMLATKISFINEIANFCEKCGGDVKMVAKGIGLDKRIGKRFLNAGIGYGGSCLPKDVKALIETGKEFGQDFQILKAADQVNDAQKEVLYQKALEHFGTLSGKTFAIWGLSFKPGTDDMRSAPSITIVRKLSASGSQLQAFDPVATKVAQEIFTEEKIIYTNTAYEALQGADALMILTEWDEFRSVDLNKVKELMNGNVIFDGRNILNPNDTKQAGLEYICIGQGNHSQREHGQISTPSPQTQSQSPNRPHHPLQAD